MWLGRRRNVVARWSGAIRPRIDASPETIANVVLNAKRPARFGSEPKRIEYRCVDCDRTVAYPETPFCDGRCGDCVSGETETGA